MVYRICKSPSTIEPYVTLFEFISVPTIECVKILDEQIKKISKLKNSLANYVRKVRQILPSNFGAFGMACSLVALVGGLFSIAPAIYQQITPPTALLTYSRTRGPAIGTPNGYRQISTFTVQNAGKVLLTDVVVDVSTTTGQIESTAIDKPLGIVAKDQSSPKNYEVTIERLLPNDVVRASVMAASESPDAALTLAVRCNEVRGSEAASSAGQQNKRTVLGPDLSHVRRARCGFKQSHSLHGSS